MPVGSLRAGKLSQASRQDRGWPGVGFAGRRLIDQGRLLLLGVLPEYQRLGLLPLLIHELAQRSLGHKYRRVEFSWVLEDNAMMARAAQVMNGEPYKRYRVFEKPLYQGEDRI